MKTDKAQIEDLFAEVDISVDNNRQLNWAMSIRKKLVENYIVSEVDGSIRAPTDVKEGALVTKLLSDMDRVSLQRERISSDEKNLTSFAEIAKSLHENRDAILGNTSYFGEIKDVSPNQELDESKIPVFEYIDGENEITTNQMDWKSFSAQHESKGKQSVQK